MKQVLIKANKTKSMRKIIYITVILILTALLFIGWPSGAEEYFGDADLISDDLFISIDGFSDPAVIFNKHYEFDDCTMGDAIPCEEYQAKMTAHIN